MNISKKQKQIIVFLIIIASVSVFLKLYTFDFSTPAHFDNLGYTLDAIQYSQGDFFMPQKKNPGWPLFIAPFYSLLNSDNFMDYSNLIRVLSLSISTISIIPMYLLARRFFNEKFSLMATILFAFEPHLNYISGQGISEPLFILTFILAIFFILKQEQKYIYLSFLLAGIFWWIRLEGIYLIVILSIIYLINYRKSQNSIRNYTIGILIFLIVISPMFIQRDIQYGDPFYIWWNDTLFAETYKEIYTSDDASLQGYFKQNDFSSFFDRFISQGIFYLMIGLFTISYPYLFILIPFGLMFSFRPVGGQKIEFIKSNWVIIVTACIALIIPFSTIPERRFLFPLLPFLIIFATIPIQRVIEYGLSTFSYSEKKKNYFFIVVASLVLLLGGIFTFGIGPYGYGQPDLTLQEEKIRLTEFLYDNLDGRMLDSAYVTEYLKYVQVTESEEGFKSYKSNIGRDPYPDTYVPGKLVQISVYGQSMEELVQNGRDSGLKYISLSDNGSYFFKFLQKDNFYDYEEYPYLEKIYDTEELGYEKLRIKIFEINYEKFDLSSEKGN